MKINRRKFLEIGSLVTISSPFMFQRCTPGYEPEYQNGDLYDLFKDPTASARPFVRWWWNGDKLTEKEILRELDLLLDAGIGGVEINPIRFPDGCDPVGYKSLEWLKVPDGFRCLRSRWMELTNVELYAISL